MKVIDPSALTFGFTDATSKRSVSCATSAAALVMTAQVTDKQRLRAIAAAMINPGPARAGHDVRGPLHKTAAAEVDVRLFVLIISPPPNASRVSSVDPRAPRGA